MPLGTMTSTSGHHSPVLDPGVQCEPEVENGLLAKNYLRSISRGPWQSEDGGASGTHRAVGATAPVECGNRHSRLRALVVDGGAPHIGDGMALPASQFCVYRALWLHHP